MHALFIFKILYTKIRDEYFLFISYSYKLI